MCATVHVVLYKQRPHNGLRLGGTLVRRADSFGLLPAIVPPIPRRLSGKAQP
jgi:hypothetical protein